MKREIFKFKLDGKTRRCCFYLVSDGTRFTGFHQCTRKATVTRKDGWYCKTHDPVERKRKADMKQKARNEKWAKINAKWNRDQRIHELFPKLVAALDSQNFPTLFEQASKLL